PSGDRRSSDPSRSQNHHEATIGQPSCPPPRNSAMVEGLHLAAHGGGIEPGVLALDQSITQIKDVEQPEAHGSATAGHAGELAHDVPGGDRLVDYVVSALKPADAAQVDVGNGL